MFEKIQQQLGPLKHETFSFLLSLAAGILLAICISGILNIYETIVGVLVGAIIVPILKKLIFDKINY